MSDTVEVGGFTYRIGKMPAREQFHVTRRLGPAIMGFLGSAASGGGIMGALGPIIDHLSKMSDEDSDYVLDHCLSVVHRSQPNGEWAKVRAPNGALMFEDIELPQLINLTRAVLMENLSGFFPAAAAGSSSTK